MKPTSRSSHQAMFVVQRSVSARGKERVPRARSFRHLLAPPPQIVLASETEGRCFGCSLAERPNWRVVARNSVVRRSAKAEIIGSSRISQAERALETVPGYRTHDYYANFNNGPATSTSSNNLAASSAPTPPIPSPTPTPTPSPS